MIETPDVSECSAFVPGRISWYQSRLRLTDELRLPPLILRIRWYQSRLRTEENDLVTLPNSMLAEKQVLASACLC